MTYTSAIRPLMDDIRDLIAQESGREADTLGHGDALVSSGLVDSFALVSVLSLIEDTLDQTIDPADLTLDNFDSLGAIAAFLDRLA